MTDMVTDDYAVFQIVQERFQSLRFIHSPTTFVAGHTMHGHRTSVSGHLYQGLEGIPDQDLALVNADSSNRDDAIADGVEARRFTVETTKRTASTAVWSSHVVSKFFR